jgi:hypothetical protein
MVHMDDQQRAVLARLSEVVRWRERRDELIREAAALHIPKTLLAQRTGLSRRGIYNILE